MYRALFLIALIPSFVYGTANVKNCGSTSNFPSEVNILGCDAAPCELRRGEVGITHLRFTVPHDILTFQPTVIAKLGLISVDYTMPDAVKIGCDWILNDVKCPLVAGTEVLYELRQEVDKSSPTMFSPELTFNLVDENKKNIVCWKWTAKIV